MNREKKAGRLRAAGCAGLLLLLTASGYAGAYRPEPAVCVPVAVKTLPQEALAAQSVQEAALQLQAARETSLLQLQSVMDHPAADEEIVRHALEEKTRIAADMEKEAALCAVLMHMGMGQCAAVLAGDAVTVVVPWQAVENHHNRVRIIDAAVTQTGLEADAVKIILAKK